MAQSRKMKEPLLGSEETAGHGGAVVIYRAPDGSVNLDVRIDKDTLWLSQKQLADLFDKDSDTIGLHIGNILKEGELQAEATTEESSVVKTEGKRRTMMKPAYTNRLRWPGFEIRIANRGAIRIQGSKRFPGWVLVDQKRREKR